VLANVLYQEARHATLEDSIQNSVDPRLVAPIGLPGLCSVLLIDGATLGPGQIRLKEFQVLVERGGVSFNADELQATMISIRTAPAHESTLHTTTSLA
jgi:hypothetical protein